MISTTLYIIHCSISLTWNKSAKATFSCEADQNNNNR